MYLQPGSQQARVNIINLAREYIKEIIAYSALPLREKNKLRKADKLLEQEIDSRVDTSSDSSREA
jgi:hypothetical protein